MWAWNIALPAAICCGGWLAMCWANAMVSVSSLSGGAMRLTRPSRRAVAASIGWPVNSMSSARFGPTLRPTATEGVPQNRPLLMPEVAKVASVEATARSHAATSWQLAAVARAWTLAITGWGRRLIDIIMAEQRVRRSWWKA